MTITAELGGIPFTKGHGTGNDFVIVEGGVELSPERVRVLCDRRFGIGGDGVLRVLRDGDRFFMDYWNSDGSLSEMCGNGVRVFARYLLAAGHVPADATEIPIATRAGLRTAYVDGDLIEVDMGRPVFLGDSKATVGGVVYDGAGVSMGNPHLVCPVDDVAPLDLTRAPAFDGDFFPEGVNVEFSQVLGPDHVRMRVYERGSGETLSCGTGACAVAVAHLDGQPGRVTVEVPGGTLVVTLAETCRLAGPAVLVATGTFR